MARDALLDVTTAIDDRASFLVEAGAGSGKTFALVHGLKHILGSAREELERGGKRVACITYTNVAKDEIRDRIAADPLVLVGTIHEFLWSVIEPYQVELKQALIAHNAQAKKPVDDLVECLADVRVRYSDRGRKWAAGRVFHDERDVRTAKFIVVVRVVSYREFVACWEFREEQTPFSTQHGVKGAEFPNVIVAVDDSAWSHYNVGNLLADSEHLASRLERTRNLFYVCCSRPKSGLAVVFLSTPPDAAVDTAREWFGEANTF